MTTTPMTTVETSTPAPPPCLERPGADGCLGFLEAAPDAVLIVDQQGIITTANRAAERLFGYSAQELVGRPIEILVPERFRVEHHVLRRRYQDDPVLRPVNAQKSLTARRRDGTEFPAEIALGPFEMEGRRYVTSIVRDLSERIKVEEQLRSSLREKEILLKEIHHRVKNNLQVTSSLLALQSSFIADPHARELFAESQHRIRSMALVHEKLYQSRCLSRVDLGDYAGTLARLLISAFSDDPDRISIAVECRDVHLSLHSAVPVGLIINELLSNSLKYAFPHGMKGQIGVGAMVDADRGVQLTVRDDGIGLPEHVDPRRARTLGLQLVSTLADQLRARVVITRHPGTCFALSLPEAAT